MRFASDTLKTGGHFVCKFYQGSEDKLLEQKLRKLFAKVYREKPESSRSVSAVRVVHFSGDPEAEPGIGKQRGLSNRSTTQRGCDDRRGNGTTRCKLAQHCILPRTNTRNITGAIAWWWRKGLLKFLTPRYASSIHGPSINDVNCRYHCLKRCYRPATFPAQDTNPLKP